MSYRIQLGWGALLTANVLALCMLGFHQPSAAAPGGATGQPFANAIDQRLEMIAELRKINDRLAEQNALLRSGKLRVQIELPPAEAGR